MNGQCNAKPVRRTTGWYRWFAACPCGWRASSTGGREDAAALAKRHNTEKQATT